MQKVIINKCYGGYGFEPFTIQKYAEAKGLALIEQEALLSAAIDKEGAE